MQLAKTKEVFVFTSLTLIILIPFISPFRYYGATEFVSEMLTVSCITLLLISTIIYCNKIIIPKYLIWLLMGGALLIATTFFNTTYLQDRLNLIIWIISVGLVTICAYSIKFKYNNTEVFKLRLASFTFYTVFLGAAIAFLAFYFADPLASFIHIPFLYTSSKRMSDLLGQPNLLAIFLFIGVGAYYYINMSVRKEYKSYIKISMLFLITYCLFATLSRAALIALVIFSLYLIVDALQNNKKKNALIFMSIMILAYLAYQAIHPQLMEYSINHQLVPIATENIGTSNYSRNMAIDYRLDLINRSLTIFSQYPITGAGFGRNGYYSQQLTLAGWPVVVIGYPQYSHNIIAQILAEFGIIGGLVLAVSLCLLFRLFILSRKTNSHIFLFSLICIFGANAMLEYALWYLNFAVLFFILFAVFSDDNFYSIGIIKTPILKVVYALFFVVFSVVLFSRWAIIKPLNKISTSSENMVYAQSMTEDRLMGLDFSNIYLSGNKFSSPSDNDYLNQVENIKNWRPSDMVYNRLVQLNIANNNYEAITNNMNSAVKLGSSYEVVAELIARDCETKNQACETAEEYLKSKSYD